jgi:hypothetical protein
MRPASHPTAAPPSPPLARRLLHGHSRPVGRVPRGAWPAGAAAPPRRHVSGVRGRAARRGRGYGPRRWAARRGPPRPPPHAPHPHAPCSRQAATQAARQGAGQGLPGGCGLEVRPSAAPGAAVGAHSARMGVHARPCPPRADAGARTPRASPTQRRARRQASGWRQARRPQDPHQGVPGRQEDVGVGQGCPQRQQQCERRRLLTAAAAAGRSTRSGLPQAPRRGRCPRASVPRLCCLALNPIPASRPLPKPPARTPRRTWRRTTRCS